MQLLEHEDRLGGVLHHDALGDLELEEARREPARVERLGDHLHQVVLLELDARDVDRDHEVRDSHLPPRLVLAAGFAQHPPAQGHDEPGLLGERDEFGGRHQAAVGVVPANQRLTIFPESMSTFGW